MGQALGASSPQWGAGGVQVVGKHAFTLRQRVFLFRLLPFMKFLKKLWAGLGQPVRTVIRTSLRAVASQVTQKLFK